MDVGVGKKVESYLSKIGYDVLSVRSINPHMRDVDILDLAAKEKRLVVTMDKDFGELVYRSRKVHAGVLLLRLEDATADKKKEVMLEILESFSNEIKDSFSVYSQGKLRVRK
jgi:predicted nuclease of predicted toxin-antitoxin system